MIKDLRQTGCNRAVVFNFFHTVADFLTQGNLTTYFDQQMLISLANIRWSLKKEKVFTLNLFAISQFLSQKHKEILTWKLFPIIWSHWLYYAYCFYFNSCSVAHWKHFHGPPVEILCNRALNNFKFTENQETLI